MAVPPPDSVLAAFRADDELVPIASGQGTCFRAGNLFLKPQADEAEATWSAEVFTRIQQEGFRVPRPLRSKAGRWVESGWIASEWVEGSAAGRNGGRWPETLSACRAFHTALERVARPAFLDSRTDPWSEADRIAWGEAALSDPNEIGEPYERLRSGLRPMRLESQVIHGDLTANVLFEAGLPPAVIDFSPYWRPAGFALAVIVADALVWGGADREVLALVADEPEFAQLLLRALMRRLLEVELHDRASGRRRPEDVEAYGPAIDLACRLAAQ